MPYSVKPAVNYFFYALYAIIMAAAYGLLTYFGIFSRGAEGFALRTYVWNLILIIVVLFADRLYLHRIKTKKRKAKRMHFVSFKASLYLFYMFALVVSRLMLLLDAGEIVDYGFRSYLLSIEYGLVVLVAADKFIDQFLKDKKQMRALAAAAAHPTCATHLHAHLKH